MPALVHPWQYRPQENIHHQTMMVVKLTVCRVCGRWNNITGIAGSHGQTCLPSCQHLVAVQSNPFITNFRAT